MKHTYYPAIRMHAYGGRIVHVPSGLYTIYYEMRSYCYGTAQYVEQGIKVRQVYRVRRTPPRRLRLAFGPVRWRRPRQSTRTWEERLGGLPPF